MSPHQPNNKPMPVTIADAEWMMIHCDTFISARDRIQLRDNAFVIDRDLSSVMPHLPNKDFDAGFKAGGKDNAFY